MLLALPAIAWALGARQPLLENRDRTPYPELNRGTLQQAATFRQIDRAFLDRLPLRGDAIEANARLNIDVFGDSPSADVAIGDDGWLYFVPALQACNGWPPVADPADAADILARSLVASGRNAFVVIPGGKFTMRPEHAPDVDAGVERCVRDLETQIGRTLDEAPGGFDIDAAMRELRDEGKSVYLRGDTHWNANGRERFVREVLDAVRPGLAGEVGLHQGREVDRPADLSKLIGVERPDRDRVVVARRAPRNPPRDVVLIGDSQTAFAFAAPPAPGMRPLIERVLPGARFCTLDVVIVGGCDADIQAAKTIVYESVGRNVRQLTDQCWRPVWLTTQHLRGTAGAFERLGATQSTAADDGELVLPAGESLRVRLRVAGPDSSTEPRLLVTPVAEGTVGMLQAPQAGPSAPCATPSAAAGSALVLPVPAGRRVSDLVMDLSSPDGARLEAPSEIVLADDVAGTGL